MSNPSEFLQVYVTAIRAAGGNTTVMASYFHVALTEPARTWLMNLTPRSVNSWEELYARFTANFVSAYQQHDVEAHLHAVRQELGETLWAFIARFTKVRRTIPRISDASIITAFRQGVCDEKMLEKLATHDVETVTTLFALADKCARAAEGRAWHLAPQTGVTQTGGSGPATKGGSKKKKKNCGHERPQSAAPIVAAATGGRNERNKRPWPQGGNSGSCPVHPNSRHNASECREIIKLAKRVSERHEQASRDGSPPCRPPGKEKVDGGDAATGERDLGYQSPEGVLKDVFSGDSDSGDDNDRRKKLYVMYGGSWELTSCRNVKSLRREVLSAVPGVPKATPLQRWRSTTISFEASDCPNNMAGADILPLITAPVIANMRLHHVLIDGGAGLNVISHAVFKQMQILGSRLGPSHPFFGMGPQPVYPLGSIALPVTFETEENFRTENVQFDVAEVNLAFNAIIGRPTLYRFMAIANYGYLVLKMSSPAGVLTVRDDCAAAVVAVEKLHALAAKTARPDNGGRDPSTSGTKVPVPKVQPSGADGGPVKTIQVGKNSSQTTRIAGNLEEK
jgi:hypothetical protein